MDKDKLHSEIVKYCGELRGKYGKRDEMQKGMEDMFLMRKTAHDAALEAISDDVVLTKSTDERVAIQAVLRLLTTTIEDVSCPMDENERIGNDVIDKVEALGGALLASNDKVSRKPLRFNTTLCASLYDEMHIQVVCTEDMVAAAEGSSPFNLRRIKRIAQLTPYTFNVMNPKNGYPVWDTLGLQSYHRSSLVQVGQLLDHYGSRAAEVLSRKLKKDVDSERLKEMTLMDYWDGQYRCTWVDGCEGFLMLEEHGLPFIPIVASTAEGSDLFDAPEDQREPFLLTVWLSRMDQRKTEALTAMATRNRINGFSPRLVFTRGDAVQDVPSHRRRWGCSSTSMSRPVRSGKSARISQTLRPRIC